MEDLNQECLRYNRKANVENDIDPIFPWIVYKFSISITGFLGVFWPPKIV